jgi:hypothetical protein
MHPKNSTASDLNHTPSLDAPTDRLIGVAFDLADLARERGDGALAKLATDATQAVSELHAVREALAGIAGVMPS